MIKKLTPKQNSVIWCLQNGWTLFTDNELKGALVRTGTHEYKISSVLFSRLVDMGLIYQAGAEKRFNFILTEEGRRIKTRPVTID